jgi:uncharacterized protein (TIGR02246 family)
VRIFVFMTATALCIGSSTASAAGVQSLSAEWASDWSGKKLDKVLALYAADAVFLPAVGPRWEGAPTIRKNFSDLLANYNPRIKIESRGSETSGNLGYDSGTYDETITAMKDGKVIAARGNYLFVFGRQQGGDWKIIEQCWTSREQPPKL